MELVDPPSRYRLRACCESDTPAIYKAALESIDHAQRLKACALESEVFGREDRLGPPMSSVMEDRAGPPYLL